MDEKFLFLFSKRSAFFFEKKKQKTFVHWRGFLPSATGVESCEAGRCPSVACFETVDPLGSWSDAEDGSGC
jgi:hypothetical protein